MRTDDCFPALPNGYPPQPPNPYVTHPRRRSLIEKRVAQLEESGFVDRPAITCPGGQVASLGAQEGLGVFASDGEELEIGAPRAAGALLPTANRVRADVQEAGKEHLAGVERAPNRANIARGKSPRRRWNFGNAKIDGAPLFKRQRILQRFAQIVEYFHFDFLGHCFPVLFPDAVHQLPKERALGRVEILLLVLVEEEEQVDVALSLQVEIHVSKATPRPFAASRVRNARFSDSSESLDQVSADRVVHEAFLNGIEHRVGSISGELVKPSRKRLRFDEYHNEVYTTQWYKRQEVDLSAYAAVSRMTENRFKRRRAQIRARRR